MGYFFPYSVSPWSNALTGDTDKYFSKNTEPKGGYKI
jgi:hypothetical protein